MNIKRSFIHPKMLIVFFTLLITSCGLIRSPAISTAMSTDKWICTNFFSLDGQDLFGPEDIAIDFNKSIAYVSSANEGCDEEEICGGIYLLINDKLKRIDIDDNPCEGFKYSLMKPHGISLYLPNNEGETAKLFVINHERNNKEDFVDIFDIDTNNSPELIHRKRIKSPDQYSRLNDLVAVNENQFYVTANNGQILTTVFGLPLSKVLFYDLNSDDKEYKVVVKHLRFANGIARKRDKLYVSTTVSRTLYSWDEVNPGVLNLKSENAIPLGTMLDNIHWTNQKKEAFFLTGNKNARLFTKKNKVYSPSSYYRVAIDESTGNIDKNAIERLRLIDENENLLSTVSTIVPLNEKLYVGSVFQKNTLPECTKIKTGEFK